jgi:hypothetical protein
MLGKVAESAMEKAKYMKYASNAMKVVGPALCLLSIYSEGVSLNNALDMDPELIS